MNKIINVLNQDGQLVVSSREVADNLEKRHDNVVRDIENLIKEDTSILRNALVIENEYINSNNRRFKEYRLPTILEDEVKLKNNQIEFKN